ncbi:MAG: hypothetical protein IPI83_03795 [Sphingomonadales bacterium]|nr:hypothetical protein [Sphingomonadales bacterium]
MRDRLQDALRIVLGAALDQALRPRPSEVEPHRAVEHRAIEASLINIAQKIGRSYWRVLAVKLKHDRAQGRRQSHPDKAKGFDNGRNRRLSGRCRQCGGWHRKPATHGQ